MGRAMGKVRFINDNKMAWFMYNATSDYAYPRLFDNYENFYKIAWVNGEGYDYLEDDSIPHTCTCGEDEEIEIYESYGDGMLWKGRACRRCMVITENLDSDEYTGLLSNEEFDKWLKNEEFPLWCEKNFKLNT